MAELNVGSNNTVKKTHFPLDGRQPWRHRPTTCQVGIVEGYVLPVHVELVGGELSVSV
jgi:hypothetical protein